MHLLFFVSCFTFWKIVHRFHISLPFCPWFGCLYFDCEQKIFVKSCQPHCCHFHQWESKNRDNWTNLVSYLWSVKNCRNEKVKNYCHNLSAMWWNRFMPKLHLFYKRHTGNATGPSIGIDDVANRADACLLTPFLGRLMKQWFVIANRFCCCFIIFTSLNAIIRSFLWKWLQKRKRKCVSPLLIPRFTSHRNFRCSYDRKSSKWNVVCCQMKSLQTFFFFFFSAWSVHSIYTVHTLILLLQIYSHFFSVLILLTRTDLHFCIGSMHNSKLILVVALCVCVLKIPSFLYVFCWS